jgi:hypothetical protein
MHPDLEKPVLRPTGQVAGGANVAPTFAWYWQTWTRSSPWPRGCVDATAIPDRREHSPVQRGECASLRLSVPQGRKRSRPIRGTDSECPQ